MKKRCYRVQEVFSGGGLVLHERRVPARGDPEKAKNLSSLFDSLHGSQVQTTLWRCLAVRTLETQHNDDTGITPSSQGRSPTKHCTVVSQKCAGLSNISVSVLHILRQVPVLMVKSACA